MRKILLLFLVLGIMISLASAEQIRINASQSGNYKDGLINYANGAYSEFGSYDNIAYLRVYDDINDLGMAENCYTGEYLQTCEHVYIDFNTSLIPDGATINNVTIIGTIFSVAGGGTSNFNTDIYVRPVLSTSSTPQEIFMSCYGQNNSLRAAVNSALFKGTANTVNNVTLSSNATQMLQNNLSANFFSVCIGSSANDNYYAGIYSSENADKKPSILVDYTPASPPDLPPNITISSPLNTTYNTTNTILIDFNATDDVSVSSLWYNNGTTNITHTAPVNLTLSNGNYTFTFYANDSANNVVSEIRIFEVSIITQQINDEINNNLTTICNGFFNSGNTFISFSIILIIIMISFIILFLFNETNDFDIPAFTFAIIISFFALTIGIKIISKMGC